MWHRSHLYRKHGINVDDDSAIDAATINDGIDDDINDITIQQFDDIQQTAIDSTTVTTNQRTAALFILKAKEERMLTQTALNGLLKDVTGKKLNT